MTPDEAVDAAAGRAGVTLRELTDMEELHAVVRLLVDVWGRSDNPPMTAELLRAFAKTGNYVAGAYAGRRLVGTCIGFHSDPRRVALHSHIGSRTGDGRPQRRLRPQAPPARLGPPPWGRARRVDLRSPGRPQRLLQPGQARGRAGGVPHRLLRPHARPINGDDDSDRLLVRWDLGSPEVVAAGAGTRRPRTVPHLGSVRVAVPEDIEALRLQDPDKASEWRLRVREQLAPLLAAGGRIVDFDRVAGYLVEPADPHPTEEKVS